MGQADKKKSKDFNIYYLNFSKVYEIAMMIRYAKQFEQIVLTEADKRKLYGFDYSKLTALRDIKRVFNDRLMTFFEEKGVEY